MLHSFSDSRAFIVAACCVSLVGCQAIGPASPAASTPVLGLYGRLPASSVAFVPMQAAEAAALAGRCGEALDRWYESAALNDFVNTANNMAVGWLAVEACRSSVGWPSASTALSMLEVSFLASTEPMVMFNLGSIYASGGVRLPYPEAASDFLFHGIRRAKHLNTVTPEVHKRLMLRLAVVDPKRAEQVRAETDYSELEHSQWRRATVERLTKQRAAEAIRTRSTPRVPVLAYRSSDSDVPDLKARFEEADRQFTATSNCVAWVKQHENVNFPAAWNNTGMAAGSCERRGLSFRIGRGLMRHANKTVTSSRQVQAVMKRFKQRVEALSVETQQLEWAFPDAGRATIATYTINTALGTLLVAMPHWTNRYAQLFALNHSGGTLAPDVEINIPKTGTNRRVSGVSVTSGRSVMICHRGDFTAYRGRMPKSVSLAYFSKWLVPVEDDGQEVDLIPVASIESPRWAEDLAEFVAAVKHLKALYKAGQSVPAQLSARSPMWRITREFEGKKRIEREDSSAEYDFLHGPLCNALSRALQQQLARAPGLAVLSNANVDVAIVDKRSKKAVAIFEVKTSASLSSQIYSAVGQLFYYRQAYGSTSTALFLVLPRELNRQLKCKHFLEGLGIGVIFGTPDSALTTRLLRGL
jgi:hypothetical protein